MRLVDEMEAREWSTVRQLTRDQQLGIPLEDRRRLDTQAALQRIFNHSPAFDSRRFRRRVFSVIFPEFRPFTKKSLASFWPCSFVPFRTVPQIWVIVPQRGTGPMERVTPGTGGSLSIRQDMSDADSTKSGTGWHSHIFSRFVASHLIIPGILRSNHATEGPTTPMITVGCIGQSEAGTAVRVVLCRSYSRSNRKMN